MDLSVREEAGHRTVLALCSSLGGGFYWEVQVTDLSGRGTASRRLTSPYKFASPAQAASDGFKAFNSLAPAIIGDSGGPVSDFHRVT